MTTQAAANTCNGIEGSKDGIFARRSNRPRAEAGSRRPATSRRASAQLPDPDRDAQAVELLPLVRQIAFQMRGHLPAHVEVDDLVSAGVLGLLDAVRRFDSSKHVKLESYARYRIRGAILDGLRELDAASRDMRKKNKKAEKVYRELETRLGRPVRNEDMAEALGVSLKKWYRTVNELQPLGVDWLFPMEAAEIKPPDQESLVAKDNEDTAFDRCYQREQWDILARAMACLSERDRELMTLYYGRELTMKEIGEELGIDESRVSQLHSAAVGQLRSKVQAMLRAPQPKTPPAYMVAAIESSELPQAA